MAASRLFLRIPENCPEKNLTNFAAAWTKYTAAGRSVFTKIASDMIEDI
jgi:hypothetical protein